MSDSAEGWCAAGNLGASRVSIRMTTGRIQGKFHFIPTSFNSFIHPVIRSYCPDSGEASFYCPSGFRGSFILLSVRLQGKLSGFRGSFILLSVRLQGKLSGFRGSFILLSVRLQGSFILPLTPHFDDRVEHACSNRIRSSLITCNTA